MKKYLICLLIGFLLAAFSSLAVAETELLLWHMETPPHRVETFQVLIDEFEELNPGISINQESVSWGDAYTKLFSAIQANVMPDICFTIPDFTLNFLPMGVVQPVEDLIAELDEKYGYIQAQLKPYEYGGHFWAVPTWGMTLSMWYRADWFEEIGMKVPKTWAEMLEAGEKFLEQDRYLIAMPTSHSLWGDQVVYSFMAANGARVFDDQGNIVFNSEETLETFRFLNELKKYSPPGTSTWNWGDGHVSLMGDQSAMLPIFGGIRNWEQNAPGLANKMKNTHVPISNTNTGQLGSYSTPNAAMILSQEQQKIEAAKDFLRFLMESERNGWWLANMEPGTYLPITEAAMESDSFWSHEIISKHERSLRNIVDLQEYGSLFGFLSESPSEALGTISAENIISAAAHRMFLDKMTPEEAVEWGQRQMEQIE